MIAGQIEMMLPEQSLEKIKSAFCAGLLAIYDNLMEGLDF